MSQPYQGRHRHASSHGRKASRSSGLTKAIRRPAPCDRPLVVVRPRRVQHRKSSDFSRIHGGASTERMTLSSHPSHEPQKVVDDFISRRPVG